MKINLEKYKAVKNIVQIDSNTAAADKAVEWACMRVKVLYSGLVLKKVSKTGKKLLY